MRLLFITNVFPSPLLPTRGPFNYELVRALSASRCLFVEYPGGCKDLNDVLLQHGPAGVARVLNEARPYPVRGLLGVRRRIEALDLSDLDVPAYVTSAEVIATVVGFHLNRGVLAAADRAPAVSFDSLAARSQRLAVLEGVGDHENLGSIFRNAAALGVDGVVLGPGCSDPLYRRSVRVSMGHVLRGEIAQ